MRRVLGRAATWARDYVDATRGQARAFVRRTTPLDVPAPDGGVTVVLLPGVWEPWRYLEPLARRLAARGLGVRAVPALGWNLAPFVDAVPLVRAAIDDLRGDVVLVAHSKGGLTGKHVLVDWARDAIAGTTPAGVRLLGLVAVATPFEGTARARLVPWWRSLTELRDGSPALVALAAETAANASIVELVPSWDPHVPSHAPLAGSEVVRLRAAGHFSSLESRETFDEVLAAIARLRAR
ncbi:esterase/lipase family protein [Agrococcus jejuensis]|uniref:Alpha/beta hydrolase family protein n=1 Tax=Agrococcus jejuensis TaxID=399736 RepID=A0A1G8G7U4_9MICO|nr:hypothetical protein [Agrococcus jejuensis]SDH90474.1 hypothetical protein SAMN04489720_2796 [Agrococcus jejuensis]